MQCPSFTRTWNFRGASYVCCVHGAEPHLPLVRLSTMAFFPFCEQDLVPVLLVGQSAAAPGLSFVRPVICQSRGGTEPQGILPVLSPELSLVHGACSQTRCLPPAHCWGCSWIGGCGCLPLSLGQGSLWSVLAPVRDACTRPGLGCHFGWTLSKSMLERVEPLKNMEVGRVAPARSSQV